MLEWYGTKQLDKHVVRALDRAKSVCDALPAASGNADLNRGWRLTRGDEVNYRW
jgi:hypothetical protein